MFDLVGLVLLLGTLAGAIKGQWTPLWIPQVVVLASLALLIYQGLFKRSRFALIHTATLWVALAWIAGHMMAISMGDGILMQIPLWTMLLVTPVVVMGHHLVQVRFSPSAGKKLELTRTETTPFKEWWCSRRKKAITKKNTMEFITFDLGEKIEFKNKSS
ncbi:MAG: hypothetical protein P4L49_10345 [Desulfosporosinus sp.]|nr:hypothetical protein [Desulfosporosinus sp.]